MIIFLGLDISSYETLKSGFNDKYEYIFPDITFDKNLMSNDIFGNLDLQSNFKVHNYDTNKTTKFLINDFDWKFREIFLNSGINSKILGKFKNINYDAKNVEDLRVDTTNEFHGAVGVLSEIKLFKQISEFHKQFLKPKLLVRYAPGNMRKESSDARLTPDDAFLLDRLNNPNNFENGLSASFGLDYEINAKDKNFYLNMAQVLNEKENKKMPNASSLNSKLSDLVVNSRLDFNTKLNFDYNFSLDHNYKDFNYNEFGANINLNPIKFDFSYLQENKHVGDQEYFKAKIDISRNENGIFSFETKRNLITNSSEFYNLSYEYMNDCLRAGLVYRREFYDDSELEAENSLMFKITIVPFGEIDTPSFKKLMYNKIYKIFLILCFIFQFSNLIGEENKIILKIENKIITSFDLKNKIKADLIIRNQELNQENVDAAKKRAMNFLINSRVKEIELEKYNFNIENTDISKQLIQVSSGNIQDLKNKFEKNNISFELFKNEIKTEIAWQQLIFNIYTNKVEVDQKDIEIDSQENHKERKEFRRVQIV